MDKDEDSQALPSAMLLPTRPFSVGEMFMRLFSRKSADISWRQDLPKWTLAFRGFKAEGELPRWEKSGKKGKNIPVEARGLSIADVYEALTSDRPYRKAFSKKQAIAIIEEEKGRKFDPDLTDIFLDMVKTKRIRQEKI